MRVPCFELRPPQMTGMLVLATVLVLVAVALPPLVLAVVLLLGLLPAPAAARLEAATVDSRTASQPPRPRHARAPPRS